MPNLDSEGLYRLMLSRICDALASKEIGISPTQDLNFLKDMEVYFLDTYVAILSPFGGSLPIFHKDEPHINHVSHRLRFI